MTVETVESEHGSKEHIVVNKSGGLYGIIVACGHNHFERPTTEYESIENIKDLCESCKIRYKREYQ